ncbi:hypothetical protein CIRG_01109 [Coccidioides immitis RMSCC 2394]|uniref:Uncharacterized protein n=1 Tax=Coccidioides immitis RMSCC 2394 TaxID=404692 RepID=A0A0J6Y1U5_COCIT|nr:hypothetical protein CIRG_01109 [Coccidioides immitis RMSCC 2394]
MPPSTPASIRPEDAETARNEHESIGRGERPGSVYHADRNSMATTGRHAGAGGGTMAEQEHTHVSTSQRMISATHSSRCCASSSAVSEPHCKVASDNSTLRTV